MRSMTGFGQARGENGRYAVAVTARAVNGRFLDLSVRLREEHRAVEPLVRELVAGVAHRGRVEVAVEIRPVGAEAVQVELREEVVRSLRQAASRLVAEGLLRPELSLGDLLRTPEAVEIRLGNREWAAEDNDLLLAVARRALEELVAARALEGEKLAAILGERLRELAQVVAEIDRLRPTALAEAAEALKRRVGQLLSDLALDEQRLAQEVAILTDKSDVSEEIDRLGAHVEHFRSIAAEKGALGKRLDFLVQEIFRELNTLGAKARHAELVRRALDAKVIAEQLREQVQNVE